MACEGIVTIKHEVEDTIILDQDPLDDGVAVDPLQRDDVCPSEPFQLEKLPRPVNDLNCRMARTYLVKLLRAANVGENPAYGNPDKKPPFWPDFYWPWTRLTDVHTKPKGMAEPFQYCEMMKLAIARGYQYYGYDPNTYVQESVTVADKAAADQKPKTANAMEGPPPRLPRPASRLNCVQARCSLSKLLRYQQQGQNPVYGSPETRPPWWPEDHIRWCDMVDLRGKPPYLPDQKAYTDILKLAVCKAVSYYGYDPELYVDPDAGNNERPNSRPSAFPRGVIPESVSSLPMSTSLRSESDDAPPKLPMPVKKMSCSDIRAALSKLLWFNNDNTPPQYGNTRSMPAWWPNHLMDWTKLKNLRHRYEGPLGNTYTNCLRIALFRGYAHFGLDPNTYVVDRTVSDPQPRPDLVRVEQTQGGQSGNRKPVPALLPLKDIINQKSWKLRPSSRQHSPLNSSEQLETSSPPPSKDTLKECNVVLERNVPEVPQSTTFSVLTSNVRQTVILERLQTDLSEQRFTDVMLMSKEGKTVGVHKFMLAAHSAKLKMWLSALGGERDCLHFPDVVHEDLVSLVRALYFGEISVSLKRKRSLLQGLSQFQSLGLLSETTEVPCKSGGEPQDTHLTVTHVDLADDGGDGNSDDDSQCQSENLLGDGTIQADSDDVIGMPKVYPTQGYVAGRKRRHSHREDNSQHAEKKLKPNDRLKTFLSFSRGKTCHIVDEMKTEKELVLWLLRFGLLSRPSPCRLCDKECILVEDNSCTDKLSWTCPKATRRNQHLRSTDLRRNSPFSGSSADLSIATKITLFWKDGVEQEQCSKETGVGPGVVADVYDRCDLFFEVKGR